MSLKRSITIVFITLLAVGISAAEPKYFQFSPKEKGNSYISADVGTQAGLSLISGSMQLGFAYSLVEKNSFYRITSYNVCYTKLLRIFSDESLQLYEAGKKAFSVGLYSIALENFEQYLNTGEGEKHP